MIKRVGIYVIESPTGAIYVGQSRDVDKRWTQYRNLHCIGQPRIFNSLKKHGPDLHKFSIQMHFLENIDQYILDHYEQAYINLFRNNGFDMMNLKEGGHSGAISEESRKKISLALKGKNTWSNGRKLSPEHIAKFKEKRAFQVFSDSDKQKISKGLKKYYIDNEPSFKGKTHSELSKKLISDKNKGKKFPEYLKERYSNERSGKLNYFFGQRHTDETKKILSDRRKGKYTGGDNPKAKNIIQYDLGMNFIKEYSTINEAAKELGISRQSINSCCGGWRKTAHGFIWRYKNPKIKVA